MADPRDIKAEYRAGFMAGVGALMPVALTFAALAFLWDTLDGTAGPVAVALLTRVLGYEVPRWQGTLASIPALIVICMIVGGTIGGAALRAYEAAILDMPFAAGIYGAAREVVRRLSGPKAVTERLSRGVVAAPFGNSGSYIVGLLPGSRFAAVPRRGAAPAFPVFISHVPTTITGFLVFTREEKIIPLDHWKFEDFAKFYTSGGLAMPAGPAPTQT